ncbi:MAG: TlpA family protein disulfide reductase [Actinobacteria bacterium]|nr:TlpA family protein disulfide reductase [Actinomycetota bacterium]MBV9665016.1 TlpA family protein disulfide reductase [Actinomycetota bacterium]
MTALMMSLSACGGHGGTAANKAPSFKLPEVRDASRSVSLAEFKGAPVLINFFGAWCVPCRDELPLLARTHARLGSKVGFVGIDTTDSRTEALDLLNSTHVTYAAGYDPRGSLKATYGVRAMPTTVFVRADGTIADKVAGKLTDASLSEGLRSVGAA